MKKTILFICFITIHFICQSQTLGGFTIIDYLVDAVHPDSCDISAITGPPDDSTWVNMTVGDTMSGTFGNLWIDALGDEVLLESSYNLDNYDVRLRLSSGAYSSTHTVNTLDWTPITDTSWVYVETNCNITVFFPDNRYVLPLDFNADFGLSASDTVAGIEIIFLLTTSGPDLAGVHIIGGTTINCDSVDLGNDTTVCNGQGLVLDATYPDATYLWQDSSSAPTFFVMESGEYWVRITTECGIIDDTINVIIANVNPIIANIGGGILETTISFASYQWYKNDTLISGATDQSYNTPGNGTYHVEVSDSNQCEDVSNSIIIDLVNGIRNIFNSNMSIHPNPTSESFTISTAIIPREVSVYSLDGKMIYQKAIIHKKDLTFNLPETGVYFIYAQFEEEVVVGKVIVK